MEQLGGYKVLYTVWRVAKQQVGARPTKLLGWTWLALHYEELRASILAAPGAAADGILVEYLDLFGRELRLGPWRGASGGDGAQVFLLVLRVPWCWVCCADAARLKDGPIHTCACDGAQAMKKMAKGREPARSSGRRVRPQHTTPELLQL